jgi:tungstate transport system substrate-binding protein
LLPALLSILLAAACASDGSERKPLDLATTTSVQNSGLLEDILPHYTAAATHVHAAGSGRALEMLSDDIVDLVISHAPETETSYLASHRNWVYRKLAYNRFIIVGPADDPAGVRQASDVLDAFRRIAASSATFVSRGDGSGTHEREQLLWRLAHVTPPPERLLVSGRSMAVALRHAQEKQAYTLSDEATFWQLRKSLDLMVVFEHDERLLNTYAVIYPRDKAEARAFADWLTMGEGRARISAYHIEGRQAFTVWPSGCPGHWPEALPCLAGK